VSIGPVLAEKVRAATICQLTLVRFASERSLLVYHNVIFELSAS